MKKRKYETEADEAIVWLGYWYLFGGGFATLFAIVTLLIIWLFN